MATQTDLRADPLFVRSVEALHEGQAASGAFVASPSFEVYQFAWLRDGAFCAYALDLVGDAHSAGRFHEWVAQTLLRQRQRVETALATLAAGGSPSYDELLPTRFTLNGWPEQPSQELWPNFQLDGYGMWLWALEEHLERGSDGMPWSEVAAAADLCARYLEHTWQIPCWGCWEEFDDGEHASTLAAIAAGLAAAGRLLRNDRYTAAAEQVRNRLLDRFVAGGRFKRCAGDERVDAALLWLALPFRTLPLEDDLLRQTVETVRRDLAGPGGGIYRYRGDTYYGGGQWILLTCSLAAVDAAAGRETDYLRARDWVRAQALPDGSLPEQVTEHAQEPACTEPWVRKWGPVATPLLWSHAMYIVMEVAAREAAWSSSR